MNRILENEVQSRCIKALTHCDAEVLNVHGHAMQKAGWPDIYVAHVHWEGWIEFKRDGEKPTTLQALRLKRIAARGTHAVLVEYYNTDSNLYCNGWKVPIEDLKQRPRSFLDFLIAATEISDEQPSLFEDKEES